MYPQNLFPSADNDFTYLFLRFAYGETDTFFRLELATFTVCGACV